ncbi:gliding motility-associated C-terminal domain-containing protein [Pontibacter sp. E15-1]|uniref:Ig-like domain-containing protein n=1 Tax=Pontibacter sp. E15-1 TaxID=2919918 RepID=UPI001F4FCAFD|nr:gliding motility-associated C-terminal domain-containing protein [Pontibacter sp. E15-1]MCJ8166721.1 gliding motility-associated C-terminal domain-containing protein [Pontibacter sp. E15-1]
MRLTSSEATGYLWSTGATTRFITVTEAGEYWVKTVQADGCEGTSETVYIAGTPDASVADPIDFFTSCSSTGGSNSFVLTIENTSTTKPSNKSYRISWGDGVTETLGKDFESATHSYTTSGFLQLQVEVTGESGCTSTTSERVFIGSNPSLGLASRGNTNDCLPATYTFDVLNTSENSPLTVYTIDFGDGTPVLSYTHANLPKAVTHTYEVSSKDAPNSAFTVTATASNPCGFTPATVGGVKLSKGPEAGFFIDKVTGCVNVPVQLKDMTIVGYNANTVNPSAGSAYTVEWEILPATGWDYRSGGGSAKNPSVVFREPGTYTIRMTSTPVGSGTTCKSSSFEKVFVVSDLATADFELHGDGSCAPALYTVQNNSTGQDLQFAWRVSPDTGWAFAEGSDETSENPAFRFTKSGSYTISLTSSNTCSTEAKEKTIVVQDKPIVSLPGPQLYCGPQTLSFTDTNANHRPTYDPQSGTISQYNWSITGPAPVSFADGTDSGSAYPSIHFDAPGKYIVSLTATNDCGASEAATQEITIGRVLVLEANSPNPIICSGESTTISVNGADTYIWEAAEGLSATTGSTVTVNPKVTTTYTVKGTDSETGCTSSTTFTVEVNPLPEVTVKTDAAAICYTQGEATLTASGADTYTWFPATGLSATTGNAVIAKPLETTTYTVTGRNSLTGCINSATVTVTVTPLPIVEAGPDVIVCNAPVPTQLQGSPAGGIWSGPHVTASGSFTPPSTLGDYELTYTYSGPSGCKAFDKLTVTVEPVPTVEAGDDAVVCHNSGSFQLNGLPAGGFWSGSSHVTRNGTFTPDAVGTFTLVYTYGTGSCENQDQVQVKVNALPDAPAASGATICPGFGTVLTVENPSGIIAWYDAPVGGKLLSNTASYETPVLARTTSYYVETTIEGGCTSVRRRVTVTVRPPTPAPTVAPVALCGPGNKAVLVAQGSATVYQWFDVATGGNVIFEGKAFEIEALNDSKTYYVQASIEGCLSPRTAAIVTVYPVLMRNTLTPVSVICAGQTPEEILGSKPEGGNGTYTYVWESSTGTDPGFTVIPGATAQHYQPKALQQNTRYRRTVNSSACTDVSEIVEVTVTPAISNNIIRDPQTICEGEIPGTFVGEQPEGGSGSYTYLWESSTDNRLFTAAAGEMNTAQNYTAPEPLTANTWYRRVVKSGTCDNDESAAVLVTVQPAIRNNQLTQTDITLCYGETPAVLTGVKNLSGGNGTYTYLWEISLDGETFENAPGTRTNASYSAAALTQTTWFRRKVMSGECSSYSTLLKVSVAEAISDNQISESQTICEGDEPAPFSGTLPSGGYTAEQTNNGYTYAWEYSTTGENGTYRPVPLNSRGRDLSHGRLTTTTWFRRLAFTPTCTAISNVVQVTVNPQIANNTIVSGQTIYSGQVPAPLIGSTPTSGDGRYVYLWEFSEDGTNYTSAPTPNTGKNYSPKALTNDTWFRRRVYAGGCEVVSNEVKITITPAVGNNNIQADQVICFGNVPAPLLGSDPVGGMGSYTYLWQQSTVGPATGWYTATGSGNTKSYSPHALTQETWFRRIVISDTNADTSAAVMVSVKPAMSNNKISTRQTICFGTAPALLTGTLPNGGSGKYTYQWEQSTTGASGGFTTAPGQNNRQDYTPAPLTNTTWFRRIVTSESCEALVSAAVQVTVTPLPQAPVAAGASVCAGNSATLTATGNGGRLEWYASASGGDPLAIGGTLHTPSLNHTTTFFVQEVAQSCASERQAVTVQVVESEVFAGEDVTVVKGRSVQLQASGGLTYSWAPSTGMDNPAIANPSLTPETTTVYTVTATTAEGCTFSDQVVVTVLPFVNVPNTFTPNQDGINDTWEIENITKYQNCRVKVFNQWGNMVFASEGYKEPWDGRFKGKELPIATYYYIIELGQNEKPISGSVTIVK